MKKKILENGKSLNRRGFFEKVSAAAATLGGFSLASKTSAKESVKNSKMKNEFQDKVAFITGGARGIGFATAVELAKEGIHIVLFDIAENIKGIHYDLATEKDLKEAKNKIESYGVKCLAIKGDVRSRSHLKSAFKETIEKLGRVDFLFANAGVVQVGEIVELKDFEIDLIVDINLKGLIKTVQAAIPYLKKQESARIILNGSITGRAASPTFSLYSTTKFGVIGFCKNVALELAEYNITCNTVCPTLVNTKLLTNSYVLKSVFPYAPIPEVWNQFAKRSFHKMPVGMLEPETIAHTVKFLCSEGARYTSGDVFDIQAAANSMIPV